MAKVEEGQTLHDLCIQHYGSYDGLADLIKLNPGVITSVDQMLPVGTELIIGVAIDQDLVNYYKANGLTIVSGLEGLQQAGSQGVFGDEFSEEFA